MQMVRCFRDRYDFITRRLACSDADRPFRISLQTDQAKAGELSPDRSRQRSSHPSRLFVIGPQQDHDEIAGTRNRKLQMTVDANKGLIAR